MAKKDNLQHILDSQKEFMGAWLKVEDCDKSEDLMQHHALDQIGHLIEELIELRMELPKRKYWKKKKDPVNFFKLREEYSDCIHFFTNLGLVIGIRSSEDYRRVYDEKHKINLYRRASNY